MGDLTKIFGGDFVASVKQERRIQDFDVQLSDSMIKSGITPPDHIFLDGKIHRFRSRTNGKASGDKTGWYVAYGDGVPAGRFGCWRAGIESAWVADVGRELSTTEQMAHSRRMSEARAVREAEQKRSQEVAEDVVGRIWSEAGAASSDHPYLSRKGIQPHGSRVTGDGRLIVPIYSDAGELTSLQYINSDGGKRYHPGGAVGGKFWSVGTMDTPGPVYLAEGFATASTIHEVTGRPCFIAYSAGNLVSVAESLAKDHSDLVVVADNDASGVGRNYADQCAAKFGCTVIIPPIEGDANDYLQNGHDLSFLLKPAKKETVIDRLQVVFGDQLSKDYEAPDELIEGLITIGNSVVVYGDSNSGKTFWALSVATAIATGAECYGRKTDPGLVVYLASEAPGSIRSRMQAIKKYYSCDLENFAMVPVPMNFYASDQDSSDVIELVRSIERLKNKPVRLIVGDTLARMSAGANENSGEDMGPVMARFESVATATGAALMIIHHNGKDAARGARGWSGIRAHIDTEIEVIEKDGIRSVTVTKQRELPSKGDVLYFKLHVIEMGITKFGSPATTCVAISDDDATVSSPHSKPTKQNEILRTLERAWFDSSAEIRNGSPYISRSGLQAFLIKQGYTDRTAKNKTEASRPSGLIFEMLKSGVLETYEQGWLFIEGAQSAAMLIRKNGKNALP